MPLSEGAPGTRASRRCDRAGRWEPGDYSHCLYTNDITRVLYTFVLVRPREERGRGYPISSGDGEWEGEPPHDCGLCCSSILWARAVRGSCSSHLAFLLLGHSDPSPSRATPSIFIPTLGKGSLKGENKDNVRSPRYP